MVGFQFVPDSAFTSRSHACPPYHNYNYPTPSTGSRHLDYPASHTMRVSDTEDVWNPLRLATHTLALPFPQYNKIQPACIDGRYSNSQYSPSSEHNGKYNFHSPDSGYGSKGTASSVSTSFADSTYGSQPAPNELEPEHVEVSTLDQNAFQCNDELPDSEILDPSSLACPEVKCDFPGCKWTGKCPSDKRCALRYRRSYLMHWLIAIGNMKQDIRSCTSVTWRPVLGQKGLGPLMTFHDIRNASINKSLSGDRRCYTYASGRTALDGIKDGPGLTTFASILSVCIVMKMRMNC